ncbi:enediyne biosynthesis protein UnbU [bacterium]|nr:enediyne biosynthesis protein UnbU [bacterium]
MRKIIVDDRRAHALKRFAAALTLFNVLGREFFGFEESWISALVAVGTGISVEIFLEVVEARSSRRKSSMNAAPYEVFIFLLPAYISSLSLSMLIYCGDNLAPYAFGAAIAICSKYLVRAPIMGKFTHILNPSATGICAAIFLLPSTSTAPPYQYIENLSINGELFLFGFMAFAGSFMNVMFTRRHPLVLAFMGGFFLQAVFRSLFMDFPLLANLVPMTGIAFFLFCFYMIPDPGTSPYDPRKQVFFGLFTALLYGVLQVLNVVHGLFYALVLAGILRGILGYLDYWMTLLRGSSFPLVRKPPLLR